MTLFEQWEQFLDMPQDERQQAELWNGYYMAEKEAYRQILTAKASHFEGTAGAIAQDLGLDPVIFAGFLDGINTSLEKELDVKSIEEESPIIFDIDWHKLLFNMHKAKAKWLYDLTEWENIYTVAEQRAIAKEYLATVTAVSTKKVGKNEPCPCGSGKKYKYCCMSDDEG